jgi:hypothetical protein
MPADARLFCIFNIRDVGIMAIFLINWSGRKAFCPRNTRRATNETSSKHLGWASVQCHCGHPGKLLHGGGHAVWRPFPTANAVLLSGWVSKQACNAAGKRGKAWAPAALSYAAHESDDSKGKQRICQACAVGFQKHCAQLGPGIVLGQVTQPMVFAGAGAGHAGAGAGHVAATAASAAGGGMETKRIALPLARAATLGQRAATTSSESKA